MKKILSTLLLIVLGLTAKAQNLENIFTVNGIRYKITSVDNHEVSVIKNADNTCSSYCGVIAIPDSVEYYGVYYKVTSIDDNAFYYSTISSLSLPQGIRSIGNTAFYCATISGNIVLPDSLRYIGEDAFHAVRNAHSVYIPALVDTIGLCAFARMPDLRNLVVDSANAKYVSENSVLYNKEKTILLASASDVTGTLVVPSGVARLDYVSLATSKYSQIVLPNTVRRIGIGAFWQCENLETINIPASVNCIEGGVFAAVNQLCRIIIDSTSTNYKLVDNAVYSFNMDTLISHNFASGDVVLPQGVKIISNNSFTETRNLNSIELPNGVEKIEQSAFQNSSMVRINLPNTLKSIGDFAFGTTALEDIIIPNSVTELGEYVFYGTPLESVVMSDSVKVIPNSAFYLCRYLNSYTGGASVERIEEYAFSMCGTFAQNLVLPSNLKFIGHLAFLDTDVKQVEFIGVVDTIGIANFGNLTRLVLKNTTPPYTYDAPIASQVFRVVIPCGATEAYMSDPNWSSYTYVEDCDGIEESEENNVRMVAKSRSIEVLNAEGCHVAIYDAMGRCLVNELANGNSHRYYNVPTAGVYVVRVDDRGYKVVVSN